jgi:hypothetical protein
MKSTFPYRIKDIHTNSRKPGVIYATVVDDKGVLCVNATLDYCVKWIEGKHNELFSDNTSHPGFGPEADPDRDYEGENTFGPD